MYETSHSFRLSVANKGISTKLLVGYGFVDGIRTGVRRHHPGREAPESAAGSSIGGNRSLTVAAL
jgi:hypothetical protein